MDMVRVNDIMTLFCSSLFLILMLPAVPVLLDLEPLEYGGRDPHMPIQKIPKGEIDVAAIARSIPAQYDNQRLLFENTQQHSHGNQQLDRRLLRNRQPRQLAEIVPGEGWASKFFVLLRIFFTICVFLCC
jgi:hypothetical protein